MTEQAPQKSRLEEIQERRRALRGGEHAAARAAQAERDFEAVLLAETEHGPERVKVLEFPAWKKGAVTLAVVRAPEADEMDAYRTMLKSTRRLSKAGEADTSGAAIQIGAQCLVYPAYKSEDWAAMIAAYAGCDVQLGTTAVSLAVGVEETTGKE